MTGAEISCDRILRPLLVLPLPRLPLLEWLPLPLRPPDIQTGSPWRELVLRCAFRRALYLLATNTIATAYDNPPKATGPAIKAEDVRTGSVFPESALKGLPPV